MIEQPTPTSAPVPISTPPHTPEVGPMCAWSPMRQSWSTVQLVLRMASSPMRASTLTTTPAATKRAAADLDAVGDDGGRVHHDRRAHARRAVLGEQLGPRAVVAHGDDERLGVDRLRGRV